MPPLVDKFMEIYRTCCSDSKTRLKAKTVGQNKCLNVNADRLEVQDWQPLLEALRRNCGLHTLSIKSSEKNNRKFWSDLVKPATNKQSIVDELVDSVAGCMKRSTILSTIQLQAVPLSKRHVDKLSEAVKECKSLQNLVLTRFGLKDEGLLTLYDSVCPHLTLNLVDFTGCGLTGRGALIVAKIIKVQRMTRFDEMWKHSLRYREPDQDLFPGIRRITLNDNPLIGDEGCMAILHELMDDLWIKAVDMQNCGLSEASGIKALSLIKVNETIKILDLSRNDEISPVTKHNIKTILRDKSDKGTKSKMGNDRDSRIKPCYSWLDGSSVRTKQSTSRRANSDLRPKKSWELSQITECSHQDVSNSHSSSAHVLELRHTKKELSDIKRDLLIEREIGEKLKIEKIKFGEKLKKEWKKRITLEKERDQLKKELNSIKPFSKTNIKNKKNKKKKTKKDLERGSNFATNSATLPTLPPVDTNELEVQEPYYEVNAQPLQIMQKNLDKLNFCAGKAMPIQPGSTSSQVSMSPWVHSQPNNIQSSPCQSSMTPWTFSQTQTQSPPPPPQSTTPWSLSQPRNVSSPTPSMKVPWKFTQPENQSSPSQTTTTTWMPSQSTTQSSLPQWFPMETDCATDSNVQTLNANMKMDYEDNNCSENRNQEFEERMQRDLNSISRSQWIFGELMLGKSTSQQNLNTNFRLRANAR